MLCSSFRDGQIDRREIENRGHPFRVSIFFSDFPSTYQGAVPYYLVIDFLILDIIHIVYHLLFSCTDEPFAADLPPGSTMKRATPPSPGQNIAKVRCSLTHFSLLPLLFDSLLHFYIFIHLPRFIHPFSHSTIILYYMKIYKHNAELQWTDPDTKDMRKLSTRGHIFHIMDFIIILIILVLN